MAADASSRRRFLRFKADRKKAAVKTAETSKKRYFAVQYLHWLQPWRSQLVLVFILALGGMAFEMVLPLATRRIIDGILLVPNLAKDTRLDRLNIVSLGVVAALFAAQAVDALRNYKMAALNARLTFSLRRRLFDRLIKLPLREISDMKSGGIVSRLSSDIDSVTGLVQMAFISPGAALAKVLVVFAILLNLRWSLALAAAALLPPLAWTSFLHVTRAKPIYRAMADDRSAVDGRVAETFGGIRVVRSFRREAREQLDYAIGHHTIIRKNMLAEFINMVIDAGWSLLIPLTSLVIVWFGGLLYLRDQASIGDIVAFQMYSTMLLFPVWRIVLSMSQTQRALASMERVFEILEKPPDMPDQAAAIAAPRIVEDITFERVTFEYKPGKPVIKDFSLTIAGGSTVALVGPSGAGKTTLTDLVARFYDPTGGCLRLNGLDLRSLQLDSYRQLLGVVQQEVFLFDGTVHENIAYGQRDASISAVMEAAERANAHTFIKDFSDGYDTIIGERGVKLSGGQRQRLSIARAILANPQILILDEATSNLDTESEQQIQHALRELFKDRTTLVIAHRLSTITHADLIAVIKDGCLIEAGKHDDLMRAGGAYFAMVERQRNSFTL